MCAGSATDELRFSAPDKSMMVMTCAAELWGPEEDGGRAQQGSAGFRSVLRRAGAPPTPGQPQVVNRG